MRWISDNEIDELKLKIASSARTDFNYMGDENSYFHAVDDEYNSISAIKFNTIDEWIEEAKRFSEIEIDSTLMKEMAILSFKIFYKEKRYSDKGSVNDSSEGLPVYIYAF